MISISKSEAEYLRKNGCGEDIHVSSRTHGSRAKNYYVTTTPKVMNLLHQYAESNVLMERF